jgi:hypothetical protein
MARRKKKLPKRRNQKNLRKDILRIAENKRILKLLSNI